MTGVSPMKFILPALAVVAVAMVCVFAFTSDQPDDPSDDTPEPPFIPGPDDDDGPDEDPEQSTVPNGFSYSDGRLSTSDNRSVSWTVKDLLHTYMDGGTVYVPSTTESRTISLEPGWYSVTARGQTFELVVDIAQTKTTLNGGRRLCRPFIQLDIRHRGEEGPGIRFVFDPCIRPGR